MQTTTSFCEIVNQHNKPVASIITLMFPGETEDDVHVMLEKAIAQSGLTEQLIFSYIIAGLPDYGNKLVSVLNLQLTDNVPGKETVRLSFSAVLEVEYFLPRDTETREFIDFAKQTRCIEALSRSR